MNNSSQNKPGFVPVLVLLLIIYSIAFFSCTPDDPTPPPTAPNSGFTYTSARVFPVQVSFVNTSTSSFPGASTYFWGFGDGTNSTIINPVHAYVTAGTYLVRLVQVYANSTSDTLIKALQLNPNGPSGVSSKVTGTTATDFTFSIPSVYLATFTNTSTNATSYFWDFGDATNSTSAATTVTHQYNTAGPFTVKLKVTGPGGTDSSSAVINF
jgi:PKD repeat protein